MQELSYTVSGLSCAHCTAAVTEEVEQVSGVKAVEVDLETKLRGRTRRRHRRRCCARGDPLRRVTRRRERDAPRAARASDRGDDLRVLRDADREAPEQARRGRGDGQLRNRERAPSTSILARGARGSDRGDRGCRLSGEAARRTRPMSGRGRSDRAAAAAADRLGAAVAAGAAAGDDRAAPVRQLAVALASACDRPSCSGAAGRSTRRRG